jgi:hypothetical protein
MDLLGKFFAKDLKVGVSFSSAGLSKDSG